MNRRHAQNWTPPPLSDDRDPFSPRKEVVRSPPMKMSSWTVVINKVEELVGKVEQTELRTEILKEIKKLRGLEDELIPARLDARLSIEMSQMQRFLKQELMEMKKEVLSTCNLTPESTSYAQKVKVNLPSNQTVTLSPEKRVVLVYPNICREKEEEESNNTRAEIRKIVEPKKSGLQVDQVRNIKKGGVALVVRSTAQADQLKKSLAGMSANYRVQDSKGRDPCIKIYDVPSDISKEDLTECVYNQNLRDQIDIEVFRKGFKPQSASKKNEKNSVNWFVLCTPMVRALLVEKHKLGIDWFKCKVSDCTMVTRCYNCQGYGHTAKFCKNKQRCGKCAEDGHSKDCTYTGDSKCANCKHFGKPFNHSVRDPNCPCYVRAAEMVVKKTNYGQ